MKISGEGFWDILSTMLVSAVVSEHPPEVNRKLMLASSESAENWGEGFWDTLSTMLVSDLVSEHPIPRK